MDGPLVGVGQRGQWAIGRMYYGYAPAKRAKYGNAWGGKTAFECDVLFVLRGKKDPGGTSHQGDGSRCYKKFGETNMKSGCGGGTAGERKNLLKRWEKGRGGGKI